VHSAAASGMIPDPEQGVNDHRARASGGGRYHAHHEGTEGRFAVWNVWAMGVSSLPASLPIAKTGHGVPIFQT
jgi:hypothetical protein